MPTFSRDNLDFHYLDDGAGVPFIFQHGLGGDAQAVLALLAPSLDFRLIALDARGHGETRPLGSLEKLNFDCLADDLIALMDHLHLPRAVVGGSSMGAGIALNCALRYPNRLMGLVLQRPAWLDEPRPENVAVFGLVAKLIREHGPRKGLETFKRSALYESVAAESSDSASALLAQFSHSRAVETVAKLELIPADSPSRDREHWGRISVPTLVLANRSDPIHPFEYGVTLAEAIPGAIFKELTPKSVNLEQFTLEVSRSISEFFRRHSCQMTIDESQMTKEIRNPNVEFRRNS